MNIVELLFLTLVPIVFLIWTLRFKSFLLFLAIGPALLVLVVGLHINDDPTVTFNERVVNFTLTVGNTTTHTYNTETTTYQLSAKTMLVLNAFFYLGTLSALALILYKGAVVVDKMYRKRKGLEEE